MTRSDYEERVFAIRRALCNVNRTLRYPDESQDLVIIARDYEFACLIFFGPRLSQIKKAQGKPDPNKCPCATLVGAFADVSFYAKTETPIAGTIPAEAVVIARQVMRQ